MGTVEDSLVVVSIMYNNPNGLTKNELLDKLNSIEELSSLSTSYFSNKNLYGIAEILDLEPTKEYKKLIDLNITDLFKKTLSLKDKKNMFICFSSIWKYMSHDKESFKKFEKDYPNFSPEKIYDFNKESGFLYPYDQFKWIRNDNKYSLDLPFVMNRLLGKNKFSLMDIVLTGEAIRRKKYEVFYYDHSKEKKNKLVSSDQITYAKYSDAVFNMETSYIAKKNKMSTFDYLRMRILMKGNWQNTDLKQLKKGLKKEMLVNNKLEKDLIKSKEYTGNERLPF